AAVRRGIEVRYGARVRRPDELRRHHDERRHRGRAPAATVGFVFGSRAFFGAHPTPGGDVTPARSRRP
ncbi:MAG: hypothetical protein ACKOVB_22410, partial [Terrabacter sp.]